MVSFFHFSFTRVIKAVKWVPINYNIQIITNFVETVHSLALFRAMGYSLKMENFFFLFGNLMVANNMNSS